MWLHVQGRGKSGVGVEQLSKLDAAVEALEADAGIPVRAAPRQQRAKA